MGEQSGFTDRCARSQPIITARAKIVAVGDGLLLYVTGIDMYIKIAGREVGGAYTVEEKKL
ncbi:MAG: hypothetical protein ABSG91_18420 [Syntrophobacteraceae bacterium]|jgi:hypothetical protein